MISGDPTSIPGLSEETRRILEEKARRAGKPFGEWLNDMLAADRAAQGNGRDERPAGGESWTQERVSRLKERIDRLSSRSEPKVGPEEIRALSQAVDKMAERIDERAERPAERAAAPAPAETFARGGRRAAPAVADAPTLEMIADALKGLEAEAGRIAAREPVRAPAPAPIVRSPVLGTPVLGTPVFDPEPPLARRSTAADNSTLRAAVAEIAARQEVIERARSTPAREAALSERVSELKGEVSNLALRLPEADLGKKVATLTDAMREGLAAESRGLAMLKEQLAQLARAVETEHQGQRGEGEAIKTEIARIGKLIEQDGSGGRTALATLVQRLEEQRSALDGVARESTLQSLEVGYRHVIGRLDELARAMPAGDQIESLSSAVTHIGESLARRPDKAESERIDAGFAELRTAITQGKSSEKVEAALSSLAGRMDKALAAMPRADLVEAILDRLEMVAERLDDAAAATKAAPGITGEIEGLKQALGEFQLGSHRKIESEFRAIAARLDAREDQPPLISQIDERLEELARGMTHAFLEAQARSQNKLETEIKALAVRMDAPQAAHPAIAELREHLEDMTEGLAVAFSEVQSGASQRLEAQIRELAARLDTQPAGTPGLDDLKARLDAVAATLSRSVTEAQTTTHERLEAQIRALTARLETQPAEAPGVRQLRDRLDTLSNELKQAFATQNGTELRIESEMRQLNQRVEAGRAETSAVAQLGQRLETLAESLREAFGRARNEGNEKLEAEIRALAARIETAEAEATTVAQLEAEFRVLTARLDEPRTADGPTPAELDLQIRALRARVEAAETNNPAIGQLEARIQSLSERLNGSVATPDAFGAMEETLGRLQTLVEQRQAEAVEAAKKAARETVQTIATPITGADESAALVEALTLDLREIRAAAENSDQRTNENLDSVQAALDRVVGRLSALEGDPRFQTIAAELSAERDSLSAAFSEQNAAPSTEIIEDAGSAGDRRADFIAAARRAAQAAAAESAAMRLKNAAETKPGGGPLSRIASVFKSRRRPLVLAAAAVVLTIAAVRLYPEISNRTDGAGPEMVAALATAPVAIATPAPEIDPSATAGIAIEPEVAPTAPAAELPTINVATAPAPSATATPDSATPAVDPSALAFAAPEFGVQQAVVSLPPVITEGFEPAPLATQPDIAAAPTDAMAAAPVVAAAPAPAAAPPPPMPLVPVTAAIDTTMTAAVAPVAAETPAAAAALPAATDGSGMTRLMAAANAGDPFAQFELADRFADGRGTAIDLAEAAVWYEKAATGGIAVAQYRVGSLYERGQGVPLDRTIAKGWYEKAAEEGNVQAMHNLAVLVAEGVGADPDIATATEWFLRAAESGVSDSQFNLGVIFARGLGRAQDLVQSYKWFALAAIAGDNEAADRREVVANMMTPDQLAQARAAVQAWRVTPPLATANSPPSADPNWATAAATPAAATQGTDVVRAVQTLLAGRGYDLGTPDGIIGAKTRAAVRDYQRAAGLPVTGVIDNGLLASLSAQTI